jgi:hypothetical protein
MKWRWTVSEYLQGVGSLTFLLFIIAIPLHLALEVTHPVWIVFTWTFLSFVAVTAILAVVWVCLLFWDARKLIAKLIAERWRRWLSKRGPETFSATTEQERDGQPKTEGRPTMDWENIRNLVLVGPAMLIVLCSGIGLLALPFRWIGDKSGERFMGDLIDLFWLWVVLTAFCVLLAAAMVLATLLEWVQRVEEDERQS